MVGTLAARTPKTQVVLSVDAFTAAEVLGRGAMGAASTLLRSAPKMGEVKGWLSGIVLDARELVGVGDLKALQAALRALDARSSPSVSESAEARELYRFTASVKLLGAAVAARLESGGEDNVISMNVDLFSAAQVLGFAAVHAWQEIVQGNHGNRKAVEWLDDLKAGGQELIAETTSGDLRQTLRDIAAMDPADVANFNRAELFAPIRQSAEILVNAPLAQPVPVH